MNQNNEITLYSTPDGVKKVGVLFHGEHFLLTEKALAEDAVVSNLETTAPGEANALWKPNWCRKRIPKPTEKNRTGGLFCLQGAQGKEDE